MSNNGTSGSGQLSRGGGLFTVRSNRNLNARRALAGRTGRAAGGGFNFRQRREALANIGRAGGRRTRL